MSKKVVSKRQELVQEIDQLVKKRKEELIKLLAVGDTLIKVISKILQRRLKKSDRRDVEGALKDLEKGLVAADSVCASFKKDLRDYHSKKSKKHRANIDILLKEIRRRKDVVMLIKKLYELVMR